MRWAILGVLAWSMALAHYAAPLPDERIAKPAQQFGLPLQGPPGPNTWLLGQLYGNTTGAYRQRNSGYRAGQGIHFGLDFSARCGTPVVAIGDGVVVEVDGPHGSPPHNLVIDHGNGLASLYGHLLERPPLRVGARVRRGQVVGKVGDSQLSCTAAPHLHLEIRDSSHQRFFNPIPYIAADWPTLSLVGGFSRGFQRDLDNPRRWQHPDQQPQARRGGPLLNDYKRPWPSLQITPTQPRLLSGGFTGLPGPARFTTVQPARNRSPTPRRLTSGGCCVNPIWGPDSATVLFIDKPEPSAPAAFYGVSMGQSESPKPLLPIAFYNPSFTYALLPGAPSLVERLSDGQRFYIHTQGGNVAWSPSSRQLAWNTTEPVGNFDRRRSEVWVAALGKAPVRVATLYGGGLSGWLDENTLLLTGKRTPEDALRNLETLHLKSSERRVLASASAMRSVLPSPDGRWVAYYVAFDRPERNGLFVVSRGGQGQRLDWFGSYRWRDARRLVYIPLLLGQPTHRLFEYDLQSRTSRLLADLGTQVSHDQWQVSPDGQRLVFLSSRDRNLWVLELP
ncbi:MAG: peptidoglycan DD-metalloendopeptidase family protein [Meiothermus sp.]|uniref:peptidoglycan DD-metalloendopeptidase family protein n=1 Tax=Meiothermus sp. TaxID=1955249 RepID=UPI0028CD3E70|nr:peptidoglycan DD-metalloendopeptidase family protein [Meiothermus sp.]MDT7919037.1 peptidoglycan DD-metalloendopeptidase family protein [Meiothermus sp.]